MASNQQVLREFLVSLGYVVDQTSQKKFDGSLLKTKFNADGLIKSVVGVGSAVQVMVALYARSMEKLYYASQRAESSASNLQALEFAAQNIGLTGEAMTGAITGMARAMRSNPGLVALVESFGIKTAGRDKADVMIDLIDKLKSMPFAIGSQFAQMFGVDADTYLMLSKNLDVLKQQRDVRKDMNAQAGLDLEAATQAGKEYSQQLRDIKATFDVLYQTVMVALLPAFKEAAGVTKEVLGDWTQIIKRQSSNKGVSATSFGWSLVEGLVGKAPARVHLLPDAQRRVDAGETGLSGSSPLGSSSYFNRPKSATPSLFDRLESQYGLPMGLLDKIWSKESDRGKNLRSGAGAKGDFQFMDGTAKQYGVDVNNLESSATGAARYIHDLMAKYNNDLSTALAAYNWGPGNVDKYGLGKAPAETRDYVQTLTGKPLVVNQATTINVTAPDPGAAGASVARAQNDVTADMVRNLRSNVE